MIAPGIGPAASRDDTRRDGNEKHFGFLTACGIAVIISLVLWGAAIGGFLFLLSLVR